MLSCFEYLHVDSYVNYAITDSCVGIFKKARRLFKFKIRVITALCLDHLNWQAWLKRMKTQRWWCKSYITCQRCSWSSWTSFASDQEVCCVQSKGKSFAKQTVSRDKKNVQVNIHEKRKKAQVKTHETSSKYIYIYTWDKKNAQVRLHEPRDMLKKRLYRSPQQSKTHSKFLFKKN